jgi:phospholipid/cholesterol/gamma-HCH transport system substrate-binding protein
LVKFRIRFAQQIVGAFVLLAILGIAAVLVLLGLNQRWFAKNYTFWSVFPSAEGLSVGMPIKLRGFEIGKVSDISLTEDNMVEIDFLVYDTYYDKVLPNSVLELSSNPLGIGGGLLFHPGVGPAKPLPEFSYVPSLDLEEGRKLLAGGLVARSGSEDVVGSVLSRVGPILDEVDATLVSIQALVRSVDRSLKGESDGALGTAVKDLSATTGRINALVARMDTVVGNVEQLTAGMTDPTGLAKKLLDPKGSVASLLDDDNRLYDQIVASVQELRSIVEQLSEFTRFVNTSQPQITALLERGRTALDQGRDVLEAVKNNPLLRGGIAEPREQPTTFQGYRDEDF